MRKNEKIMAEYVRTAKNTQTLFESQDHELIVTRPAVHAVHLRLKGDENLLSVSYGDIIPSVWLSTKHTKITVPVSYSLAGESFYAWEAIEWKRKANQLDNLRDALGLKVSE